MNTNRFVALRAAFTAAPSRRTALRVLGGFGLAGSVQPDRGQEEETEEAVCEGRADHQQEAQAVLPGTGQGRHRAMRHATPHVVPHLAPHAAHAAVRAEFVSRHCLRQPAGWMWGDTELRRCPANQICLRSGLCQACDVTCPSGDPAICGDDLQSALDAGGTVYVCPGRYQRGLHPEHRRARHRCGGGRRRSPATPSSTAMGRNGC